MLIDPLNVGGVSTSVVPARPSSTSTELTTTSTSVEAVLVQPENWGEWQAQRELLHQDNPDNPAISAYRDVADAPLRESLQQLVGVDLYV